MINLTVFFILILVILEVLITLSFFWLKKDFQWLVGNDDLNPLFEKKKFENFLKKSFDKDLGWDRKSNTKGYEVSNKKTFFKINADGSRGFNKFKKNGISVYGDSFAFCRYVNDKDTWQFHLSKKYKFNVLNFGVGNYGLDQAFLKYLKNKKRVKSSKVVFCVVPETIARVFSYWKHFREFKNIFAIKPLYNFEGAQLEVIGLPKLNVEKISKEKCKFDLKVFNELKKNDIFYEKKFMKNIFKFPYLFSFFKNFNKNLYLFIYLIFGKITSKVDKKNFQFFYLKAYSKVLEINIRESHDLYEKNDYKENFNKLLNHIDRYFKKNKIEYSIMIVPQYYDLKLKKSRVRYINFYKNLRNKNIMDMSNEFLKVKNWQRYYFVDKYGGHLNKDGNQFLASLLLKKNL